MFLELDRTDSTELNSDSSSGLGEMLNGDSGFFDLSMLPGGNEMSASNGATGPFDLFRLEQSLANVTESLADGALQFSVPFDSIFHGNAICFHFIYGST